jgi:hypothetical protein
MIMTSVQHVQYSKAVPIRKTSQDTRECLVEDRQSFFLVVNG